MRQLRGRARRTDQYTFSGILVHLQQPYGHGYVGARLDFYPAPCISPNSIYWDQVDHLWVWKRAYDKLTGNVKYLVRNPKLWPLFREALLHCKLADVRSRLGAA